SSRARRDVARSVAPGIRVRFDLARDGERLVITRLDRLGPARGPGQPEVEDRTAHHGGVVGPYLAGLGAGGKTTGSGWADRNRVGLQGVTKISVRPARDRTPAC